MITINDNNLIINVPCMNESPLEKLATFQSALITLIGMVDHKENFSPEEANAIVSLSSLLNEMMLDALQLREINKAIDNNDYLKQKFI